MDGSVVDLSRYRLEKAKEDLKTAKDNYKDIVLSLRRGGMKLLRKSALLKILVALTLTLGILLALGLTVHAAEYDLWITEIQVTDENRDDVLGDGIVRYDSENRILYLYGNIYSGHSGTNGVIGNTIIRSEIDGLTIDVMKNSHLGMFNTYGNDPEAVMILEGDTTIKGNGELNLYASGYWLSMSIDNMIYLKNADLVIDHMTLNINKAEIGNYYGIKSLDGNVKIIASDLNSHGSGGAIFCKNGEISIDGCMITSPGGVNNKNGEIRDSSDKIVSDIKISKTTHKVSSNALNVREGPGTDYSRIGGLLLDKEVVVIVTQGEWSKIVYGIGYGWVQSKYLVPIEDPSAKINPFVDIYETDDYYNAVLWAYYADPQITNGMDETHFGPLLTVTRGQCVTFLWRSQGCPEPTTTINPFVDVSSTEYYYTPILWAVENGITKGVDATHFKPMDTLSTQHIVTFLYRTKNPGMDGWNGDAETWAGQDFDGKPFGVNIAVNNVAPCPRADVVLFIYRCNGQSSFDQKYWVIFTEGYRGNRVEAATIDSILPSNKLYIIWDTKLELNDSSGSGKCDQYYLNKEEKWVKMGNYDRFSENATKILASNLDVYDKNGEHILYKSEYEYIDWEMIKSYS